MARHFQSARTASDRASLFCHSLSARLDDSRSDQERSERTKSILASKENDRMEVDSATDAARERMAEEFGRVLKAIHNLRAITESWKLESETEATKQEIAVFTETVQSVFALFPSDCVPDPNSDEITGDLDRLETAVRRLVGYQGLVLILKKLKKDLEEIKKCLEALREALDRPQQLMDDLERELRRLQTRMTLLRNGILMFFCDRIRIVRRFDVSGMMSGCCCGGCLASDFGY